jgi:hypothetical protein
MAKKQNKQKSVQRRKNTRSAPIPRAPYAPVAMGGPRSKGSLPVFSGNGLKCIVQNYEYAFTLTTFATDTFASLLQQMPFNPGNANFTWLSSMALNWSKYKWHFLRFIYVPTCPTTIPGKLTMCIEYDYADSDPTTINQMSVSESTATGPVWYGGGLNAGKAFNPNLTDSDALFVDFDISKQTQDRYYVRQGVAAADVTPGNLQVATSKALFNTLYGGTGDVYVAYICELFEPVATVLNQ